VPESFVIALAQCESLVGTSDFDPRPGNIERAARAIRDAGDRGADLVVFGEMFLTGYRTDDFNRRWALTSAQGDPHIQRLAACAADADVQIMIGAATRSDRGQTRVRNSALLIGPKGLVHRYDKLHVGCMTMPDGRVVDESRYFDGGDELCVWATAFGLIGPQVCYDSWFPEHSRLQSLAGAAVLINISASVTGSEKSWGHLQFARAFENGAWYVVCSTVGQQKDDEFVGRSAVVSPAGDLVVEARAGVEDLVFADIDASASAEWRTHMNCFGARRPDVYGDWDSR
jgi:predicted amidohydrolase